LLISKVKATITVYSTATWINHTKDVHIWSSWNYVIYKQ
jgi:hypothetical protein